ncbi:MAG: 5-methyltetrahydropteroyltriglutamate--homocysteine S-methyltransferase [Clostridiales bacterium]|jgi:5-methyltetrahydropteroyltriglutamate--homocysteine methyltransferase|nr:5-methyltetrahydropteroyltriglutamate--homocysteine S-methyltransferase [Clostridiales bacterium]
MRGGRNTADYIHEFRTEKELKKTEFKTAVIGFPRIGEMRELKFAAEKYFRGEIGEDELMETAKTIRKKHWLLQAQSGIDYITVGDFSFYDNLLDAAALFNCVPKRYKLDGLTPLGEYFAMARGYQGYKGDVKALAMKKWFNTNYHYIAPEIDGDTEIKLIGSKLSDEYAEARALLFAPGFYSADGGAVGADTGGGNGIKPKWTELPGERGEKRIDGIRIVPAVIGGFTFVKLARLKGVTAAAALSRLADAYSALIEKLAAAGADCVRFDEPFLATDLEPLDVELFTRFYAKPLAARRKFKDFKVYIQTYFGDIRDCYRETAALDFDGIGLDFTEGENLGLLEKYGFPKDKTLFAGVVDGKNIWKTDYKKTLALISDIKKCADDTVISTSCSLLHVPYSVKNESKLSAECAGYFAFAAEKLTEIRDLARGGGAGYAKNVALFDNFRSFRNKFLFCADDRSAKNAFKLNEENFGAQPALGAGSDNGILRKNAGLNTADFERRPALAVRRAIQKRALNLPPLPTTTIGSFPQTADVKNARAAFKRGELTEEEYAAFNRKKIAECIALQEKIGLDVLVHGEYERNDMVEYFGERLEGFVFTENAWVQSYGTRTVKPPIIFGDIRRVKPITVEYVVYAQSLTEKPVKGMLTGPITILNWSFPRPDAPLEESAFQIALAIREEALDLERNGIKIIQIDEAALREKLPLRKADRRTKYLDWAIPAFRLTHSGLKPETQVHTHMCYSEFGGIIKDIEAMDADVISFEASRSGLDILDAPEWNGFAAEVGPGVYDIHSPRVPSVSEIKNALSGMIRKIGADKLWVNPDCGLKTRGELETEASLKNLTTAARKTRETLAGDTAPDGR